jgi:predicted nucleic acid-binding protein
MIVIAAMDSGCDVLWTEDLTDRLLLRGVQIRNPFTDS